MLTRIVDLLTCLLDRLIEVAAIFDNVRDAGVRPSLQMRTVGQDNLTGPWVY
jgi:hypothetical protein